MTSAKTTHQWATDLQHHHYLYLDENDQAKHLNEIESIAREVDWSVPEVLMVYEDILEDLSAHAVIPDYLPVLVSKKVRALCKRKSG